jgi:alkanesulfonate monooxygenase SsuD/methylene tetrahydromethanopterin reductase-like flavin-dependent oxidoreductase (luciferase family)
MAPSQAWLRLRSRRLEYDLEPFVSPLPRFKPWEFARQTASLDHLSHGLLTLGIGLGDKDSCDHEKFSESGDNMILAEKLDESLDIITGLWTVKPFS